MDHSGHSGADTSSSSSDATMTSSPHMTMHMTFYGGPKAVILFDEWTTTRWGYYLLSLVALFLIAFLYQYLQARLSRMAQACSSPPYAGSLSVRALHSALYTAAVAVAYFLMLAVMTFNAGIFIVITLGFGSGFFLFHSNAKSKPSPWSDCAVPSTAAAAAASASASTLTPKLDPACCP